MQRWMPGIIWKSLWVLLIVDVAGRFQSYYFTYWNTAVFFPQLKQITRSIVKLDPEVTWQDIPLFLSLKTVLNIFIKFSSTKSHKSLNFWHLLSQYFTYILQFYLKKKF